MRIVTRTACVLALLVTTGLSTMLKAQVGASAAEQQLFGSVNRARRNAGLPALKWNDALASAAKRHAGIMAQRGEAQHGFAGEPALASRVTQAGARFVWLSENVALGASSGGNRGGVFPISESSREYVGFGYGFNWDWGRRARWSVVRGGRFFEGEIEAGNYRCATGAEAPFF